MATFNSNVFSSTYRDDYADSDNYYRILFNNGRALQARELTQLQTIIQSEISRFGRNIFKDGAVVNPGGPTLNRNYEFIKLNTASPYTLPADTSALIGLEFTGATSGVKARVLQVVAASGSDPATIYVAYTDTSSGTSGSTSVRMTPSELITSGGTTLKVQTTNTVANPAIGRGTQLSCQAGDFFVLGRFVFVEGQSILLSKYSRDVANQNIGFLVTQDIVTASDNSALYDNSGVTPNLSAPGADRYRIRLTLTTQDDVDSDEMFVFYCEITDNAITKQQTGTEDYNKITEVLAQRTFEESGNYIVNPFSATIEDTDSDDFILRVSPGLAYVNGYRANVRKTTRVALPKPVSTEITNNQAIAATFGNYVYIDSADGLPNIAQFDSATLYASPKGVGTAIGSARIRAIEEDGADWRAYLFDINMYSGQSFRDVKSIGSGSTNNVSTLQESGKTVLYDTLNNSLLFSLPKTRPQSLSDTTFTVQRRFTSTTNGSGVATITLSATGETFVDTTLWVCSTDTGNIFVPTSVTGTGTQSATITNASIVSSNIEVLAYVNKANATVKAKTLTTTTVTRTLETVDGQLILDLAKADLYDVLAIKKGSSGGQDLTNSFTIDNGQRDNYYGNARLILKPGLSNPGTNIYCQFRYFTHGTSGDFFAVNSYTGVVDYGDIPSHRLDNGILVNLRNVIDFRPTVDSSGEAFTGTNGQVINLPRNTDVITSDVNYYLGRNDRLVLNERGYIELLLGEPSANPSYPSVPSNALDLYQISLGPNTLNKLDAKLNRIDARRYTMADITRLDEKIDKVRDMAVLSLLELDTKNILVLDSAGNNRTKAGFLVDNFANFDMSGRYLGSEYRAAVDPVLKELRPRHNTQAVGLAYDASNSSNITKKGNTLMLDYTETKWQSQDVASGSENINPFQVVTALGIMELSPQSDDWKDIEYADPAITDGGTILDPESAVDQQQLFNEWQFSWSGIDLNQLEDGQALGSTSNTSSFESEAFGGRGNDFDTGDDRPGVGRPRAGGSQQFVNVTETTTTSTLTVSGIRNVTTRIAPDTVLFVTVIPWMRSKKVYFRAYNLKPNTKHFAFFDGVSVADWIRSETFQFASDDTSVYQDPGTQFKDATQHPQTPSVITTDANGYLAGSFFIPSGDTLKFATGTLEFKLLDVTVDDDEEATSIARVNFTSRGVLETLQENFVTTRNVMLTVDTQTSTTTRVEPWDPLAQTFTVSEENGAFLTKVRVYFKTKDSTFPVRLEIRPVVNGVPSSQIVRAFVNKNASAVTSQINPATGLSNYVETIDNMLANGTDFTFDEPVYLSGGTDYAIVLLADSINYKVYVGEMEKFVLGSTEKRVTEQPTLGSLFKSQNGSTWEPSQKQDLTYRLFKAQFDTAGGYVVASNRELPLDTLRSNPLLTDSGGDTIVVSAPRHGFDVNDTVDVYGLDSATRYANILGSSIMGSRTITAVDGVSFSFAADSDATSSASVGGSAVKISKNIQYTQMFPNIARIVPPQTSLNTFGRFITGTSLAGTETRYQAIPSTTGWLPMSNRRNNTFLQPLLIANPTDEGDAGTMPAITPLKSATFKIDLATKDTNVSPLLDLDRMTLQLTENIIDKQDSASSSGFNIPIDFVNETNPTGGSALAKHITIPVVLAEDAVGIKVLIGAHRPPQADFQLYYRTAEEGVNLSNQSWVLKDAESTIPADDNPRIFREYEYVIGGAGGSLNPFTQFQLKIVMRSTSSARVPKIRDLRAIALVD